MKITALITVCLLIGLSPASGLFFPNSGRSKNRPHPTKSGGYGPPKPIPSSSAYHEPETEVKPAASSYQASENEIDGYGAPAAPLLSGEPDYARPAVEDPSTYVPPPPPKPQKKYKPHRPTYRPPPLKKYRPAPPPKRRHPLRFKMPSPLHVHPMMNPMNMIHHFMMKLMKPHRPNRPRNPKPRPQAPTASYGQSNSAPGLDYGGWQPIGGEYGSPTTSQPVYGDTPVLTADNTYSVSSNAAPPPLPSSGYPPEPITAAPAASLDFGDSYGSPAAPLIGAGDSYSAAQSPVAAPTSYGVSVTPIAAPSSYSVPSAPAPSSYSNPSAPAPAPSSYSVPAAPAQSSYSVPAAPAPSSYSEPSAPAPVADIDSYGVPAAPVIVTAEPDAEYISPQQPVYANTVQPSYSNQPTYNIPVSAEVSSAYSQPKAASPVPEQDSYGIPKAAPIISSSYATQPAKDSYGIPQASPLSNEIQPSYSQPPSEPDSYGQPLAPLVEDSSSYEIPQYSAPVEEPLFEYAPISDLTSLAEADADIAASVPPSKGYTGSSLPSYSASSSETQPTYSAVPGLYQATGDAANLAEEPGTSSVYVQPNYNNVNDDDLFYVHYQKQEEPAPLRYGRKRSPNGATHSLSVATSHSLPPLYHHSRHQPAASPTRRQSSLASSESSFNIKVNGQSHGYSHGIEHKI